MDAAPKIAAAVRRYSSHRKLYHNGGYIPLRRIAELIRAGEEVVVTDAETLQDATSYVLAQLLAQEAEAGTKFDVALLRQALLRGESA